MVGVSTFAPKYAIEVQGTAVDSDLSPYIRMVQYESADGLADALHIRCQNPDSTISDSKIFQPGNEVSVYMGYEYPLTHIGRVIIQKRTTVYPEGAMPSLTAVGYTKDAKMMDNSPEGSKDRRYTNFKFSDAVWAMADRYGMEYDVDDTPDSPRNFFQRNGVSDYDFVNGLANLTGYVFWVDGDQTGKWTLHFKNPETLKEQDKIYTYTYADGDNSTLLSYRGDLLISGAKTKIAVVVKDRQTGKVIKVEVEEENNNAPDIDATGGPTEEVIGEQTTGSDIKLYFGDFSFDAISNKSFRSEEEAAIWARQWFRRERENFILSQGKTIGHETLMARQVHNIAGVGKSDSGQYYFSKVKHTMDSGSGYYCTFHARKVTPKQ